jgi:hypothetical protein
MALTPKQRKAALERGFSVQLATPDDSKYRSPNPKAATQLFAKARKENKTPQELPADRQTAALPADGLPRQTVDRQHYRQTVSQDYRQTGSEEEHKKSKLLPADGRPAVSNEGEEFSLTKPIPLAPVQWAIWEALCEADAAERLVSYRKLAHAIHASIRGVRDALAVIDKEGGIISKVTIRTPDEQGMLIRVDRSRPFQKSSLKETKGLLKREGNYRQTVDRQSPVLPADGLRLSVCINNYIKQTDIAELLPLFPPTWNIRERTLVEIVRQYPRMTLIEFRRSLLLLVGQVTKGKTQIQNHNAWLKAAFAKNEGPLVTEKMIEAQLDHVTAGLKGQGVNIASQKETENGDLQAELSTLRQYVTARAEDRAIIDEKAREKAAAALRITPEDKHGVILEQALIEASREYFLAISMKDSE